MNLSPQEIEDYMGHYGAWCFTNNCLDPETKRFPFLCLVGRDAYLW